MILKGSKIYLQEGLREEDYALILKGYTDLSVFGFVYFAKEASGLKTVQEVKKFVNRIENETVFGIYSTLDNKFIGYTTLEPEPEEDEACEYSVFILDKDYWGKGIGEEVTKIMVNYIFNILGFKKTVLTVAEHHEKAIALYEKIGFKRIKLIPNDREIFLDGKWIKSGTAEMALDK